MNAEPGSYSSRPDDTIDTSLVNQGVGKDGEMILQIYTIIHTLLSLIAIVTGIAVLFQMLGSKRCQTWTKWFLITAVATTMTGFFFPFHGFTPAIGLGIISLPVLGAAIFANYSHQLTGSWRWVYAVTATIALYFNVFVLIVQLFQKLPALRALAPTQTEPPFQITQIVVLALFVLLTIAAAIRFHPEQTI